VRLGLLRGPALVAQQHRDPEPILQLGPEAVYQLTHGALGAVRVQGVADDHLGDTVRLAKKYGATVVAIYEICTWVAAQDTARESPNCILFFAFIRPAFAF